MSFCIFLPPYCRAFCIICSTVYRCISPHQAVLETVVKMSEVFRKTQPKGIWLYAGTTHWLFSMQNKMQRKPIWDALATFLLTTQLCFCQINYFWIRGEQIIQYSNTWDRVVIIVYSYSENISKPNSICIHIWMTFKTDCNSYSYNVPCPIVIRICIQGEFKN